MAFLLPTLEHFHFGKVRDTYLVPKHPELLLMVASDRISTHNVVHRSEVKGKGALLTALSLFWTWTALTGMPTHVVAYGKRIWEYLPKTHTYPAGLEHRAIIVRRREVHPIEFIWRSYLMGSLEKEYRSGRDPYGLGLRKGLKLMHSFGTPAFTPTDKSETDDPLRASEVRDAYPKATHLTHEAYQRLANYLAPRGITLIDAKFEASKEGLVDEWGTGDCCRMAWTKDIQEGVEPPWLDKEAARQFAMRHWNGGAKAPVTYTDDELRIITGRYMEAFEAITGTTLSQFQRTHLAD